MTSTQALKDEINLLHQTSSAAGEKLVLFFITGNPGLIEYYRTFLTLCFDSLRSTFQNLSIQIYGTSLKGFEVQTSTSSAKDGPFDLEQQIQYIGDNLERKTRQQQPSGQKTRVVLVGHSVGSYILLEVLRRHKDRSKNSSANDKSDIKIVAGLCLFPTVTDIAQSPSGQKFSVRNNPCIPLRKKTEYQSIP